MYFLRPESLPEPTGARAASNVELRQVCLDIHGRRILSDVTLSLHARRIGIIGANGSGKSTLARIIAGLVKPDTGTVEVNGVDVCASRTEAIREIGIVFQNPDHQIIFPTVEEDLAFGPRQQGVSSRRAQQLTHDILDRFGVVDWAERPTGSLSQGQKHLVCLLAVLIMEPVVLVMDEPFTGLDLRTVQLLTRLLSGLEQTIIHVTHDLTSIMNYDQAIWIDSGKVASIGDPSTVIDAYIGSIDKNEFGHAVTELAS